MEKRINFHTFLSACYEVMMHEATNSAAAGSVRQWTLFIYWLLARQVRPGVRGSGQGIIIGCQTWPAVFQRWITLNLTCPKTWAANYFGERKRHDVKVMRSHVMLCYVHQACTQTLAERQPCLGFSGLLGTHVSSVTGSSSSPHGEWMKTWNSSMCECESFFFWQGWSGVLLIVSKSDMSYVRWDLWISRETEFLIPCCGEEPW